MAKARRIKVVSFIPKLVHDKLIKQAELTEDSVSGIIASVLVGIYAKEESAALTKQDEPHVHNPKLHWKEKARDLVLAYEDTHVTSEGGSLMFWLPGRTAAQVITSEKESRGLELWLEDLEKKGKLVKIPVDTDPD